MQQELTGVDWTDFILNIVSEMVKFSNMEKGEGQLVQRIARRDPQAEQELLSLFGSRIARKVRYAIGAQNDDWKDVVNDIILAVLENLRDGKFDVRRGYPLGSYIYGIVNNKTHDYFKAQKKEARHQALGTDADFGVVEEFELEKKELQAAMKEILKRLKHKYQQVLFLKYYEEMSVAEISEQIDLPPRRVSERLNYAVKLLQKEMKNKNYFSIFAGLVLITV